MKQPVHKMAWSFETTNPRFVSLLKEAIFRLDPMNTACVENHAWDEYDSFVDSLVLRMLADDTNTLTFPMIADVCKKHFGEFGAKRVNLFFGAKADAVFLEMIAGKVWDYEAPVEIREFQRMSSGDLEWGMLETIEEFATSVEIGAVSPGDEDGHWVAIVDGVAYNIGDAGWPTTPPAAATHSFWWGK